MRPRTDVLLLCRSQVELSRWRLVMETRGNYRVVAATSIGEARGWLLDVPEIRVAVTTIPGMLGADSLAMHCDKVLLFGVPDVPRETLAQRVDAAGPELAARMLTSLRELSARKRGPKPATLLRSKVMERDGVPA